MFSSTHVEEKNIQSYMNKDILTQYADIKKDIKMLEAKLDEIQPEVLSMLVENEAEEVQLNGYGTFTLCKKRKWIYTEETQNMETLVKTAKKLEEQKGDATYTESPYVVFKGVKE